MMCGGGHVCRSLYNAALIARLVLTWFPNPPAQLVGPLSSITDRGSPASLPRTLLALPQGPFLHAPFCPDHS